MTIFSRLRLSKTGLSKLQKISQHLRFDYKEHTSQPLFLKKDARIENWQAFSRPGPMPSTHKKVVVRKMDRDSINGYVAPANYIREGKLELLNTSGNVVAIDLRDIKGVYFVREFGECWSLSRKPFTSRPSTEGLW